MLIVDQVQVRGQERLSGGLNAAGLLWRSAGVLMMLIIHLRISDCVIRAIPVRERRTSKIIIIVSLFLFLCRTMVHMLELELTSVTHVMREPEPEPEPEPEVPGASEPELELEVADHAPEVVAAIRERDDGWSTLAQAGAEAWDAEGDSAHDNLRHARIWAR